MSAPSLPQAVADHLPTPCLLVDLPAADRNIERAAARFRSGTVRLRPHFKAHKCTRLLRRQVDAGGCSGVTCQTAAEALVLARAGFVDILVANEIVDPTSLDELAEAAALQRTTVAVDSAAHVRLLSGLATRRGVKLGVVIELDVGMGKCGLPVRSPELIDLAGRIASAPGLDFRGVQAYEGHVVMREDRQVRGTILTQIYAVLREETTRLADAGFPCELVSGGGTGTMELAADAAVVNEVQAGSYVLMDAKYASIGLPFEPALYLATRVISRRTPEAGVLNAGLKETTVEYGLPIAAGAEFGVLGLADEHTRISIRAVDTLAIGDLALLIPAHIDPTINLHDALFVWDGALGIERWPVDGRRATDGFARRSKAQSNQVLAS